MSYGGDSGRRDRAEGYGGNEYDRHGDARQSGHMDERRDRREGYGGNNDYDRRDHDGGYGIVDPRADNRREGYGGNNPGGANRSDDNYQQRDDYGRGDNIDRGGYSSGRGDEYSRSERPDAYEHGGVPRGIADDRHDSSYASRRDELRDHGRTGYGSRTEADPLHSGTGPPDYYEKNISGNDGSDRGNAAQHSTGTSYGGGGAYGGRGDLGNAANLARRQYGDSNADDGVFDSVIGSLSNDRDLDRDGDIDEEDAIRQHRALYGDGGYRGDGNQVNAGNIGSAAAMQALKMFTEGKSSGTGNQGASQGEFVGMAMGQAAKLYDQQNSQGATSSGTTKQDVIMAAAKMALKMYMKSEMGGSQGATAQSSNTGSNTNTSGGGGLLGLASKFLLR